MARRDVAPARNGSRRETRMRQSAITAGALAAGLALGGAFVASAVDGPDAIHACVDDKTGGLRIASSSDECRTDKKESPLTWNVQGPQGNPGPQGIPGPRGAPGQDGQDGAPGVPGVDGQDGADAEPCSVSDDGAGTLTLTCPDGSQVSWEGTTASGTNLTQEEQALADLCAAYSGEFEGPATEDAFVDGVGFTVLSTYSCDLVVFPEDVPAFSSAWDAACGEVGPEPLTFYDSDGIIIYGAVCETL